LVEVLAKVPTGRLVVLGEPGAGKTMLMVRLVLDLLRGRSAGGPVPILASVASWNPADQDLRTWLAAQLIIDHPALDAAPSADRGERDQAAALLAAGLILPILDGLDEIPEDVRGSAISRINDALRPGEQLVVTCRSDQYREALRPEGGVEVTLRAAAAVQLRPLDADAVRGYLCADAGGPVAKARWDPVLKVLGTEEPAGQALGTPLMASLARTIYNPRPGELAGALRDPAELCDPSLPDRTAVESLLFDAFIPAAYRHDSASRWKAPDAERWLVFLARHLDRTIGGPDLAWWQLPMIFPIVQGWVGAEAAGIAAATAAASAEAAITVVIRRGFVGSMFLDTEGPGDVGSAASPMAALARARSVAVVPAAVIGIGSGIIMPLLLVTGHLDPSWPVITATILLLVVTSFMRSRWPWYETSRVWLALRHRLPWSLMSFLADAHRRGVLRQAGAVYQFRHIELQHRLATRRAKPTGVS
jgi:hypothetical protein